MKASFKPTSFRNVCQKLLNLSVLDQVIPDSRWGCFFKSQ